MIVLQIEVRGHAADVRWAGAQAVLGSAPVADLRREDAGWAPREALLVHATDAVVLVRVADGTSVRLRPGDAAVLGDATVTLVGLAPLARVDTDEAAEVAVTAGDGPGFDLAPVPSRETPIAKPPMTAAPAAVATPPPPPPAAPVPHARRSAWAGASFEEDLFAAVRKSPWFVLSAAIHALALILLAVLGPAAVRHVVPPDRYGVLTRDTTSVDPLESGGPQDPDPVRPPEEYTAPDVAPVPEPPRSQEAWVPPTPDARQNPDHPLPEVDPDAGTPPVLIGPSEQALRARVTPKSASPPTKVEVPEGHDEAHAFEMNRKAAAVVREQITRGGGALGKLLRGLRDPHILVVRGSYDHMEIVLEELGIPFTQASPYALAHGHDWSDHKAVFWNCGLTTLQPAERQRVAADVREFVRAGGYLFTTDWALEDILMPAFPRVLDTTRRRVTLPELVVDVRPASAAMGHALLDGVLEGQEPMRWWLERSAHDVRVLDASRVTVLLEAPELGTPRWDRGSAIAVTFEEGRGRVLHLVGHHYQQKSNLAGAVGAQRLPLNFLRMRLEADGRR
ncbi:MAG TPA: hypothetical protein VND21_00565 [Planctomycetota bacterium]|nr:hypothetical protein [Planctomycetota bacterium]